MTGTYNTGAFFAPQRFLSYLPHPFLFGFGFDPRFLRTAGFFMVHRTVALLLQCKVTLCKIRGILTDEKSNPKEGMVETEGPLRKNQRAFAFAEKP